MSYQVFCTFDLKNADSQDYKNAYSDLADIGLERVVKGKNSDVVIPTTSAIGDFDGSSVEQVRDEVRKQVRSAFKARGFRSEIFLAIGEDGTWGSATT